MDALSHFKQGKGIDKLGDTEKVEEDNKNYFDETMDLEKAKTDLKESLYGDFNKSEIGFDNDSGNNKFKEEGYNGELVGDRDELTEDQSGTGKENPNDEVDGEAKEVKEFNNHRNLELFKEHPFSPIIERFSELPGVVLEENDIIEISKVLNNYKFEDIDYKLVKDINIEPDLKLYLKNFLFKIEGFNERKSDLSGEIKLPDDFKGNSILVDIKNPVVELLASNYLKIPNGFDGESDFDMDIQTAFDISLNKTIEGKNFPRTEGFDIAVKDIKSGDLETKLKALSYIYSLVNTHEGLKGAKSKASFDKIKNLHINKKISYIEFKLKQIEKQIENESNEREIQKLNEQLQELIKLKEVDDFKGEVFSGGEQDTISEEDPLANLDIK